MGKKAIPFAFQVLGVVVRHGVRAHVYPYTLRAYPRSHAYPELEILWVHIYANIEHQSKPQKLVPLRTFRYKLAITKRHLDQGHKKAPIVLNLIFYHGKS